MNIRKHGILLRNPPDILAKSGIGANKGFSTTGKLQPMARQCRSNRISHLPPRRKLFAQRPIVPL
jgi:hypothetical protein